MLRADRILDAAAELAVGFIVFLATDLLLPTWLAGVLAVAAVVSESKRHDRERAAGPRRLLRRELAVVGALVGGAVVLVLAVTPVSVQSVP